MVAHISIESNLQDDEPLERPTGSAGVEKPRQISGPGPVQENKPVQEAPAKKARVSVEAPPKQSNDLQKARVKEPMANVQDDPKNSQAPPKQSHDRQKAPMKEPVSTVRQVRQKISQAPGEPRKEPVANVQDDVAPKNSQAPPKQSEDVQNAPARRACPVSAPEEIRAPHVEKAESNANSEDNNAADACSVSLSLGNSDDEKSGDGGDDGEFLTRDQQDEAFPETKKGNRRNQKLQKERAAKAKAEKQDKPQTGAPKKRPAAKQSKPSKVDQPKRKGRKPNPKSKATPGRKRSTSSAADDALPANPRFPIQQNYKYSSIVVYWTRNHVGLKIKATNKQALALVMDF